MIEGREETRQRKARSGVILSGRAFNNPGGFLLSHAVACAVPNMPAPQQCG
jgi:hypothetical protein